MLLDRRRLEMDIRYGAHTLKLLVNGKKVESMRREWGNQWGEGSTSEASSVDAPISSILTAGPHRFPALLGRLFSMDTEQHTCITTAEKAVLDGRISWP